MSHPRSLPPFHRLPRPWVAAAGSRLAVFGLAFLCLWLSGQQQYDTSSISALKREAAEDGGDGAVSASLVPLFSFANWDGIYFLRLALVGHHEQEKFWAFFPGLPAAVRYLAPAGTGQVGLLVIGLCLNFLSFVAAAELLYALTERVFSSFSSSDDKDDQVMGRARRFALLSSYIFCFSPAGIFWTAFYTESLFVLGSFAGLLALEKAATSMAARDVGLLRILLRLVVATACFVVAATTRSNGILLSGFVVAVLVPALVRRYRGAATKENAGSGKLSFLAVLSLTSFAAVMVLMVVAIAAPYLTSCLKAGREFCSSDDISNRRPWCNSGLFHQGLYSFVQKFYWGNGLFAYYSLKHVPQLITALPAALCGAAALLFFRREKETLSLLLRPSTFLEGLQSFPRPFPYLIHFLALVCVGMAYMHTQVVTRFVATSPAFYWLLAWWWERLRRKADDERSEQKGMTTMLLRYLPAFYCVGYTCVGTLLFVHFYHWT